MTKLVIRPNPAEKDSGMIMEQSDGNGTIRANMVKFAKDRMRRGVLILTSC